MKKVRKMINIVLLVMILVMAFVIKNFAATPAFHTINQSCHTPTLNSDTPNISYSFSSLKFLEVACK